MRVLDVAATREVDRRASEDYGIPSLVLMENAALGVVEALEESFPGAERILVLCGPGNNGGDGLAVARHLAIRGRDVRVWLVGDREARGDAAVQERICRRQGLAIERLAAADALPSAASGWDLAVDALFGVGLGRPLTGLYAEVVAWLERRDFPCLAVDLPSGLAGDSSVAPGPHVSAELTVTFETPKPAHVLPPACDAVGELVVVGLGIPPAIAAGVAGDMELVTTELAAGWLAPRRPAAHKGSFGHVLVVAGSEGMGGAAVLAARGAIRGGAGLVTCAVPERVLATVDAASLESMTLGLPASADGGFAAQATPRLIAAAAERDVLALGPGLGSGDEARTMVRDLVAGSERPLVLDASGLAALVGHLDLLRARRGPTIITPHAGELGALLGVDSGTVVSDRVRFARQATAETGAVVLLKGQATLVADGDGVSINTTGNPGMATGGTGDVLTGLVAALWAQGFEARRAAALAAFVHGAAGDLAAEALGETALAAGDLLARLPEVLRGLEEA